MMDMSMLAERLTNWIRDKAVSAGCAGVVVGISGGIDSAVAAALGKRAFPDSMLGVIMPCHSGPQDKEHALELARSLSLATEEVILDAAYDGLVAALPDDDLDPNGLVLANIKPRLRMTTLYYFAAKLGYLVVGGSNRDELNLGYFTKYGDGGVDLFPLGNLVKSQVKDLARVLGVPRFIIDKPPSAGLWSGQTDEAEMGLFYDDIDRYILTGRADDGVKAKIEAMMKASAHKLKPPPVADIGDG